MIILKTNISKLSHVLLKKKAFRGVLTFKTLSVRQKKKNETLVMLRLKKKKKITFKMSTCLRKPTKKKQRNETSRYLCSLKLPYE